MILITGCARSGTSLTAGLIEKHGAWGGEVIGKTPSTPAGMFENSRIRNEIIKPYLKSLGVDPMGQNPIASSGLSMGKDESFYLHFYDRVMSILKEQGYVDQEHIYIKDPKISPIWPVWRAAFPFAKWVIVRREAWDIASSCIKTVFMRAFNNRNGWRSWVRKHQKNFDEIKESGAAVFEFWPFRVINGDYGHAEELINWVGLKYDESIVDSFVDPHLWHYRQEEI